MQNHHNRSRRLSLSLRSRFIIPCFSSPLSLFLVLASVPFPIYFSGLLSSFSGSNRNNKPLSIMRFNSNIASTNISCTTFNILAPIYKRVDQLNQSIRESDFRALWFTQNQKILDLLLHEGSSVICLQEVWVGNEELVNMYHNRLATAGYTTFQLARTNGRGDGLLTAIHKDYFKLLNYRELLFNDFGERVAQLLHVKSVVSFPLNGKQDVQQEVLIVNTHLLFPHDSSLSIARLHQVYKILEYLEAYQKENKLTHMPIILCGDWNGSKRGHVYKFLRSQGFISSCDVAHQYTDSDAHRLLKRLNFSEMKFSLYFLGYEDTSTAPTDPTEKTVWTFGRPATIELTHNWGTESVPEFKGYHNGNSEPRGFGHIGVTVDDVHKPCERFEQLGVEFVKEPNDGKMKNIAFIKDPDGYWIEIKRSLISRLSGQLP